MRGATLAHRVVRGGGMNPPPLILRGRCASPGYPGFALVSLRSTSRPPRPPPPARGGGLPLQRAGGGVGHPAGPPPAFFGGAARRKGGGAPPLATGDHAVAVAVHLREAGFQPVHPRAVVVAVGGLIQV